MKPTLTLASAIALALPLIAPPAHAQDHDHSAHAPPPMDHSQMCHDMSSMTGALGPYPMTREASGTSWRPDAAAHAGVHSQSGDWMLMTHATLNGVYTTQDGPRGDDKAFLSGMAMATARRSFDSGDALQVRAMLGPDPFMGKSGYPLLFAAGETADGRDLLIDRQHPHDLFMELSASYSKQLTNADSLFVYLGLPGEPAFGPPAFMHRTAAMDSPEAPITHHWLDSTHITFGVATLGWVHGPLKLEASRFHGREPDEHRFDIETGDLDSTAIRLSLNPTPNWSLQASWADVTSPEQIEPDQDQSRLSASALYSRDFDTLGQIDLTLAWGQKQPDHGDALGALILEGALRPDDRWTIFSRAERIETNELSTLGHHGPVSEVSKIAIGAVRDFQIAEHVKFGLGAQVSKHFTDDLLSDSYGGDPSGALAFVRLKLE